MAPPGRLPAGWGDRRAGRRRTLAALLLALSALAARAAATAEGRRSRGLLQAPAAGTNGVGPPPPPPPPPLPAPTVQAPTAGPNGVVGPPPPPPPPPAVETTPERDLAKALLPFTDPEPEPAVQQGSAACTELLQGLLANCPISYDRISLLYSRSSEEPPTAEVVETAIQSLEAAGLPPSRCCQVASGWESEGCACSEEAQAGLGTLLEQLLQLGTEELAFLLGATRIIDAACGVTTPPCQAG